MGGGGDGGGGGGMGSGGGGEWGTPMGCTPWCTPLPLTLLVP